MQALDIRVYEIFKSRFSESETQAVIEYFEAKAEEKFRGHKESFITVKDKETLLTVAAAKEIFATRDNLHNEITAVRKEISDLVKRMIGLFIPIYLSVIGLFITVFSLEVGRFGIRANL